MPMIINRTNIGLHVGCFCKVLSADLPSCPIVPFITGLPTEIQS
ncbi:MAG: hypothetical protein UH242_07445 [Methanobrevibacter sp.]|nr:hypothetical protein [Methanobrevibacter sp.]